LPAILPELLKEALSVTGEEPFFIMPVKYSKDGKVCFHSETHTYWNGYKPLKGVTTHIGEHKEEFDSINQAAKYAEKNNLQPWDVLYSWRTKGNSSRDNGTSAHGVFETYFETKSIPPLSGTKDHVAAKFINDYFETGKLTFVECESIVYNDELASMRDCVARNIHSEHFIFDWKANEKISTDNYGKFLLPPYAHIPACSFYEYSLQVRLYQKMSTDYDIKDCFIVHLKENDYQILKAADVLC